MNAARVFWCMYFAQEASPSVVPNFFDSLFGNTMDLWLRSQWKHNFVIESTDALKNLCD